MKISYVTTGNESIASFRYRVLSPAQHLRDMGCMINVDRKARPDADIVVFGKHWQYNDWSYSAFCGLRNQKVVYDVCDDHFHDKHSDHYRRMCEVADMVTCNSEEMASVILAETGRIAYVIPDPVLSPRRAMTPGDISLLWYGQAQNFKGLVDVYDSSTNIPLEVILPQGLIPPEDFQRNPLISWSQWHPRAIEAAATRNTLALLPYRQGKPAKSANRVLEALWSGLPVITDRIPAVSQLASDLSSDVIQFLDRQTVRQVSEYLASVELEEEMGKAQDYIAENYSQEAVARGWKEVFSCV